MPGRNGAGPMGGGAMTGRGFGPCVGAGNSANCAGPGLMMVCRHGRGYGYGFQRGHNGTEMTAGARRVTLQAQKKALTNRLEIIDRQLESL